LQEIENEVIQTEVNFKKNNDQSQENARDVNTILVVKRECRGPTKMKRLSSNPSGRIEVEFDVDAKPIGDGSIKISTYLGPLVREHVSVTLDKWKQLSDELHVVLWECIHTKLNKIPIQPLW